MKMSDKIRELFLKYKSFIFYAIFGVLTTVINIAVYWLCRNVLGLANVPGTVIAWVAAVLFAFITNKLFVFDSKDMSMRVFFSEMIRFFLARIATGILEVLIMFIGVDVMHGPSMVLKVITNIIVIIVNYILSKLLVFIKKKH